MSENFDDVEQCRAATMERYRKTQLYLASGSNTKKSLLEKAQLFGEVIPILDENADLREKEDHATYLETPPQSLYESRKGDAPAFIALGKIERLIANGRIPQESLALAVDTMAQFFPRQSGLRIVSLERPNSHEQVRKNLFEMLISAAREYILFRDELHSHEEYMHKIGEGDSLESTTEMLWSANQSAAITVNTGVAIKFPKRNQIKQFSVEIRLFPQAIFDIVEEALGKRYETKASQYQRDMDRLLKKIEPLIKATVDKLMQIDPDHILSVSGGIDYGDRRVRECLKLRVMKDRRWIPEEEVSEGWFRGMPTKEIRKFLEDSAI